MKTTTICRIFFILQFSIVFFAAGLLQTQHACGGDEDINGDRTNQKLDQAQAQKMKKDKSDGSNSVLLKMWSGPYGGVPPWRSVNPDEFLDAFDVAIEMSKREIETIANNPEPATFDNTIAAMENAGRAMERLQTIFGVCKPEESYSKYRKPEY